MQILLLKALGKGLELLTKFLPFLFIYNKGKEKRDLQNAEKSVKDAKDANIAKAKISSLSKSDRARILGVRDNKK